MCSMSLIERVLWFAGMASARAMLSDSNVVATLPPASWRNLRRLTFAIRITSLVFTGGAPALPCSDPPRANRPGWM